MAGAAGGSRATGNPEAAAPGEAPSTLTPTITVRTRFRRVTSGLRSHPLLVVLVGATVIALGHALWIWSHRHLGGFDPDESGYLASSLRFERTLRSLSPFGLAREVATTGNGVTVPVLSIPLTLVGPRDPRTAMMIQPVLLVFTAVATAGITRRITGPWAAMAAGLTVAALPTISTATQSYWYGLGATACLAGAIWALVASDRCRNRWIWWFGVGLGLMCLSRTMSLGYVPAAVAAGLIVAGRDRDRLLRLAGGLGLAFLIAAPWYLVNLQSVFGYLFSYGFGERAALFGGGNVIERTSFRVDRYSIAFGDTLFTLLWASALCVAVLVLWQWRRRPAGVVAELRSRQDQLTPAAAVLACVMFGTAALVSTSNNGVWFELPMVPLLVVLSVAVISAGPRWYCAGLAAVVLGISAWSLATHWWLIPYEPGRPTAHYEYGFAQYDERFGPDSRDRHAEAAQEWDDFYRQVLTSMRPDETGTSDPVFTLSGNMQLFNTNSLSLVGELDGWSPRLEVPDTGGPPAQLREYLAPTAARGGQEVERLLVIAEHDLTLFTPDADVAGFAERADRLGWVTTEQHRMPTGGRVRLQEHEPSS